MQKGQTDANMFFRGIPKGDQEAIIAAWAKKHGGILPWYLAIIRVWPGPQTAEEWLASHNGHVTTQT